LWCKNFGDMTELRSNADRCLIAHELTLRILCILTGFMVVSEGGGMIF